MKIRTLVLVSLPVSLASLVVGCWDYTSDRIPTADTLTAGTPSNVGSPTSGTTTTSGGGTTTGGTPNEARLPCEILQSENIPCVSAHSTIRVLVPEYAGPLYQLIRLSDNQLLDIGLVEGYADAVAHDAFCADDDCEIEMIYDQSGVGNHLTIAPPGEAKSTWGNRVEASKLPVTVGGRPLYGMLFRPGEGYRAACNDCPFPPGGPMGTAVGDEPQTMYMVTSQHDLINGCCFNYGNGEVTANNDGNGTMEAVYVGHGVIWGTGVDAGPWVMADLENGLYAGWENGQDRNISSNTSLPYDFITAIVVGDTADKNGGMGRFALYGGDATQGVVKTMYDGIRPVKPGYVPAQKQGSVILAIGGDNSDFDGGRFYEGVMANGVASLDTVNALQAAIVAVGYGK